ncbi:MAG: long-chain fatty acid--CoA ligase [Burkholderiales bacterium]|nr:long-chain fatty acid--CoA ligase [Burkholderiales bacterium]
MADTHHDQPRAAAWPHDLPRTFTVPRTPVHHNLEVSAARWPDRPLTVFYDTPLTYAQAWIDVQRVAGFLQRRCGVRHGDRVLLDLQNSPQFIVAYYAVLAAGAMVVPVNPMNLVDELRHYVTDSGARVAIAGQELLGRIGPLAADSTLDALIVATYSDHVTAPTDLPLPEHVSQPRIRVDAPRVTAWVDVLTADLAPDRVVVGPDDRCVMPYTSGTTGQPKGCIHLHRSVQHTAVAGALWFRQGADTTILATLPFFHVTGMQGSMNGPIWSGATTVLMQRWDRDVAARLIARWRVEGWTCISTMAVDFLSNPDLDRHDLSSMRRIGGGGAAMPEAVAKRLHDRLGLDYIEGYGLSETIAPTHINPPDAPKRQCLGIPIFGTDAHVMDPDTHAILGPDTVGEIVVRGPQVFQGYWGNAVATREAFVTLDAGAPFFRTGDLGRRDAQGYYFIVDRLKRMINASGLKVWPAEVEALLYAHPDVQEACVIAAPDATRGETVKALVVRRPDAVGRLTEDALIAWSREQMAAYKIPRIVEFVDTLPKSATGKVQWRALQDAERAKAGA